MAQQSLSCRFIVCWNFLFRTKIQHNIQNDFVFRNAERTIPVFNNRVCPSGIKARNQTTIFVHSDRKLRLVAIMERMLHPDRRFHNFLYKIRGKAADPDQVVFDLAVLKGELLFIGNRLQLTAATLSRIRTDRLHAVGRNGVEGLTKEAIGYENGVLGGVVAALQAFSAPGEAILVHSPTYTGFTSVLNNNGRRAVHTELKRDAEGIWRMDYEDMDKKIKENHIHLAIFCSPHNPSGRVWEREEIEAAMEVYRKNDCIVISDEIWSDLTLGNRQHIPTQTVSEDAKNRTIAMYAPTKTFNLAGLIGSYHIVYNPYLRDRMNKQTSLSHYNNMNIFSMHGLIGAYSKDGQEWADELKAVLTENMEWAYDFITKNWDGVELAKPEGTYMLYLDCHKWCEAHHKTMDELLQAGVKVGVIWQDGRAFFYPDSIRMNLALPFSRVQEAFHRLDKYVFRAEA